MKCLFMNPDYLFRSMERTRSTLREEAGQASGCVIELPLDRISKENIMSACRWDCSVASPGPSVTSSRDRSFQERLAATFRKYQGERRRSETCMRCRRSATMFIPAHLTNALIPAPPLAFFLSSRDHFISETDRSSAFKHRTKQ